MAIPYGLDVVINNLHLMFLTFSKNIEIEFNKELQRFF